MVRDMHARYRFAGEGAGGQGHPGRVFNLTGEVIDGRGPIEAEDYWPIHRESPPVTDLSTHTEIFETGIKVIDLLTPFVRGGKAGLFGGRAGQDRDPHRADRADRHCPRRLLRVRRRRRADPRRHDLWLEMQKSKIGTTAAA